MSATSPSWNLSRYVRSVIVCNDLSVADETATVERIDEVASNLVSSGHGDIEGYNSAVVRAILLDESVMPPYPPDAPQKYVGK